MLGAILGGVGSVVSGLFGSSAAKKQADLQKKFAQKGIQWKVADSLKAGIHPLYGLGANTIAYQPQQVGGLDMSWLGDMGQEIDRSRMATSDPGTRKAAAVAESLALERGGLENDLLRAEIAKTRAQIGPPMPTVDPKSGLNPEEVNPPTRTAGLNAGVGYPTNPNFSDAASFENRYGDSEIASMLVGLMNAGADLYHWGKKYYVPSKPWVKKWPTGGIGRFAGYR